MTEGPDHEIEVLEDDQTIPPRPEEFVADANRDAAPGPSLEEDGVRQDLSQPEPGHSAADE